jgi:hypothetical protein
MTELLEQAFARASALPEQRQNQIAAVLLSEIEASEEWERTLHAPQSLSLLDDWAAEALLDLKHGRTEPTETL